MIIYIEIATNRKQIWYKLTREEVINRHSNGAGWDGFYISSFHTRFSYTYPLPYPYPTGMRN